MNHTATSTPQTSPGLFGLNLGNHNETLITARPARGLAQNHNETLITARPARGLSANHSETLIADSPVLLHPDLRRPAAVRPAG